MRRQLRDQRDRAVHPRNDRTVRGMQLRLEQNCQPR